jgi:hypothetical protein
MRNSDLRWSHIHAAIAALEQGATGPEAATEAGVGPRVWRLLRGKRSGPQVLALLTKNDPDGERAFLSQLDELCRGCLKGRPVTSGMGLRAIGTSANVDRPVAKLLGASVEL